MPAIRGERIRVRGLVQGVGFRPFVWHLAQDLQLSGEVSNDGDGVLIQVWGCHAQLSEFVQRLRTEPPPLARIDEIHSQALTQTPPRAGFHILDSDNSAVHTGIVPDAATCPACLQELHAPDNRRYQYPFINCTHCGPRLSIVRRIPYDRAHTSMAEFALCPECGREYRDPADRRFHAQPNACPVCGPRLSFISGDGKQHSGNDAELLQQAQQRLHQGDILAVKGIGGFHLVCDASQAEVMQRLRERKQRPAKAFALMAKNLEVIRAYCQVSSAEAELLQSPAAPIVILQRLPEADLPESVAPQQNTLGFMLPYSPLHHLLLQDWDSPLIMTSGNLHHAPQCIDNQAAQNELAGIVDGWLLHNREIINRLDDSVAYLSANKPRVLRRARGYAPAPLVLAKEFAQAPPILALGAELKSSFCLLQDGQAVLSQHLGDLDDARNVATYQQALALYQQLFEHQPRCLAADLHPNYHSSRLARDWAARDNIPLIQVQHHHAHIAAVLAENTWSPEAGPVLGIALDGLGYGDDGSLWGGEILLADYRSYQRLGHLSQQRLLGGNQAMLEPWRNTYAHLATHFGIATCQQRWPDLAFHDFLQARDLSLFEVMLARGLNSPFSSSAGRLFDAVAALLGICPERIHYEGQAAMELEALAAQASDNDAALPFSCAQNATGLWEINPAPCWEALCDSLQAGVARAELAAQFHRGLGLAVVDLVQRLAAQHHVQHVAISGGVTQNRRLFAVLQQALNEAGLQVLSHQQAPANDGGVALGQAVIAAMHLD